MSEKLESFKTTPYYHWAIASLTPRETTSWLKELEDEEKAAPHLKLGEKSAAIAQSLKITDWTDNPESLESVINATFAQAEGQAEESGVTVDFG